MTKMSFYLIRVSKGRIVIGLLFSGFWILTGFAPLAAQDKSSSSRDDYVFAGEPTNCEINIIRMETVTKMAINELRQGSVIIAIARLGTGELSPGLNRRRLHNLRAYLTSYQSLSPAKVVSAEGLHVSGYGRVEIYVGGKLAEVLLIKRGGDLCLQCCESDEKYYPNRKPKKN